MNLRTESSRLVGLSLGSNLGDRLGHLQAARDRLRALADPARPFLQAPVYQTAPVNCPPGSPDFLNTVVAFHFTGGANDLHTATRSIEVALGRPAGRTRNAPRPIDIDILLFGAGSVTGPGLTIPHPRIHSRRFVLQPFADLLPDFVLPGDSRSIAEHLAALPKIDPPLDLAHSVW